MNIPIVTVYYRGKRLTDKELRKHLPPDFMGAYILHVRYIGVCPDCGPQEHSASDIYAVCPKCLGPLEPAK